MSLMRPRHAFWTLALGAAIAWPGPARAQEKSAPPAPPESASTAELEAIYKARTDSARTRFVQADVDFMSGMIHHHAQALVMSGFAPSHGASPTIQTLAARIINAQKDEIAWMERWLRDRGQPVPETGVELAGDEPATHGEEVKNADAMTHADHAADSTQEGAHEGHAMHEAHHAADSTDAAARTGVETPGAHGDHALMPGMLTPEQMQELDQARGAEFDRLFLTYMIQHHKGAVTMVDELFGQDGAAQDTATFKLASDVQVDQRTEIARMERMLSALPAQGGAP